VRDEMPRYRNVTIRPSPGSTLEPPTTDGTDAVLDGPTVELSPEAA
jgi:hypothetical protein